MQSSVHLIMVVIGSLFVTPSTPSFHKPLLLLLNPPGHSARRLLPSPRSVVLLTRIHPALCNIQYPLGQIGDLLLAITLEAPVIIILLVRASIVLASGSIRATTVRCTTWRVGSQLLNG